MNCEESRHLIRLDVGNDLRPTEQRSLVGHLQDCAACRTYRREMDDCMAVLAAARELGPSSGEIRPAATSCWASLSTRIQGKMSVHRSARQFNGWVAAVCVCSLLLAFGTIVQNLPTAETDLPHYVPAASSVATRVPMIPDENPPNGREEMRSDSAVFFGFPDPSRDNDRQMLFGPSPRRDVESDDQSPIF